MMENYIVRVYRRENSVNGDITGVVEKPDSGENISFHNNEEFLNIFVVPAVCSTTPANRKQVVEKRKYRRFYIKNSTLIFEKTTDIGEIVEISLGGLSFYCPNMPDDFNGVLKVGILCEGFENFCTGKINCKKIMLRHLDNNSHDSRNKFSIEFGKLTHLHKMQLEHIIKQYALSEA
jgi:hypothetical protein